MSRSGCARSWAGPVTPWPSTRSRTRSAPTWPRGWSAPQREFLLRQQLAAIRKELGELGDDEGPVAEYRAKVEAADLPADVRTAIEKEIDRLERTSEQNPEGGWIRTWLDTVLDVPWGIRSDDRLDVEEAREVLDADHTGLSDVKDRIIEYLAVRKLRAERGLSQDDRRGAGAIVALVGPPGVGKTSLGESVARAMGRKFVRVALGGVHDEAEIRGHRRTYVGAAAGRIVRAIREAGTMNPVLLLDEVDKLGSDWRGDPSSALLEVLDPAQNHTFRDHYLEVDLDLSDVVFLATANVSETIPGALLDRMELVRLDGYTEDEKVAIGRDHLLARQLQRNGLVTDDVTVTEDALRAIVSDYTREAGVRGLERELGKLLRKVATAIASDSRSTPVVVEGDDVATYLGRPRFFAEAAERTSVPGVATGLAVTGAGGDVLFIEASSMDGEGLVLTGQLGDVMKESAEIALSYVRSHADDLEVSPEAATKRRFHVHVPAGAVPKDGPSAGVTMTTALTSLLTGRPVRSTVGMTGEVTLAGQGAADRRRQAEGAGRPSGRSHRGRPARPQRRRPGRRPRGGQGPAVVPPGGRRRRRARRCPGAHRGRRGGRGDVGGLRYRRTRAGSVTILPAYGADRLREGVSLGPAATAAAAPLARPGGGRGRRRCGGVGGAGHVGLHRTGAVVTNGGRPAGRNSAPVDASAVRRRQRCLRPRPLRRLQTPTPWRALLFPARATGSRPVAPPSGLRAAGRTAPSRSSTPPPSDRGTGRRRRAWRGSTPS